MRIIQQPLLVRACCVILLLGSVFFTSCSTVDKASADAATWDNSINSDARKLQHHMEHYQG